jgi:hypothetical protein
MDSRGSFVELFGANLTSREGLRPMRRLVDLKERAAHVEANAPDHRPKSLTRIAVTAAQPKPEQSIRVIVEDAYARAGEPHCCEPRDLSEGLGIPPIPAPVKLPFMRNGSLYYPQAAPAQTRNVGIYYELALVLSPYSNVTLVMDELILPTSTALRLTVPELEHVQPHVPIERVLSIYMRHGTRSGQWTAVR